MNTFIHTILNAEQHADELIERAREDARDIVAGAKEKAKHLLDDLERDLKDEQPQAIARQKQELASLYKQILEVGTARANEIAQIAKRNRKKAIEYIISHLTD